ncbi:PadR family transcriptional regulator [Streptomyces katsurahamanus]|uniref:PadR family transcriptional regulator n=1 Tax=Streptomyces katsurahamanus TaxID=2577098 RepID=A0ABW9NU46_9ACTN|nr:PadR family transcriptional regulator [Streptomyces katsurahamanus]
MYRVRRVKSPFRITSATLDVLEAFLSAREELHGFAVAKAAGKPTGSIYPILARLEQAGWLDSHWETEHPEEGRPRRRFYALTPHGGQAARAIVLERRGELPTPQTSAPHRPRPAFGSLARWRAAW